MPASVPVATSDVTASVSPEHVREAQDTGRQLIAFLAARDAKAPPIWDSLAAQQRALRLRDALHENKERLAGDPQWRIGRDEAGLRVLFGSSTVVRSEMVWRDQRWLVRSVATEIRQ